MVRYLLIDGLHAGIPVVVIIVTRNINRDKPLRIT
jgi:hypothetical protein